MNSAEKPYEHLSSAERGIFDICGEIIKYKWGKPSGPELFKLRERATKLFTKMREIDLSEHDSYFKLIAEANELKKEFEKIRDHPREHKYLEFDLEKNSLEEIADKLLGELADAESVRALWYWVAGEYLSEEEQVNSFYDDMTMIDIMHQEKSDNLMIGFNEMFSHNDFISSPHIQIFYEKFHPQNSELYEHIHEPGIKESWLEIRDLTPDQTREIVVNFIKIIKENPRVRKDDQ